MKAIVVVVVALVLFGCATAEDPKPKEPPGMVDVYREPSSRDGLFPMVFMVDGRPVVSLRPGEERSLEIKAGDRTFGYELGVYHCTADVRIESGRHYVYRLAHGCVIEPRTESEPGTESEPQAEDKPWTEDKFQTESESGTE